MHKEGAAFRSADEQFRHRDLARPPIRGAAGGICRGLHLHPLRARRARAGQRRHQNATSILDYVFRELAISYLAVTTSRMSRPRRSARPFSAAASRRTGRGVSSSGGGGRRGPRLARPRAIKDRQADERRPDPLRRRRLRRAGATSQGATALKGEVDSPATLGGVGFTAAIETAAEKRAEARMKGYVGEACPECGNFTMVRNGTCLKCDTCGGTTGCS